MRRSMLPYLLVPCLLVLAVATTSADDASTHLQAVDMDGQARDIDAMIAGGHNVVLVFWQTWCGPCRREAPHLAEAARTHAAGLSFLGVVAGSDQDVDDAKVRKYVEQYSLPYPQIRDRDLSLTKRYEVVGTPTIIILGPEREVLFRGSRPPDDWSAFARHPGAAG